MNAMKNHHAHRTRRTTHVSRAQGEQGWVLIATLIISSIAAGLTMTWARHAVLSKGTLEMAHGASETEEHVYSGIHRTREKMRQGKGPGTAEDGEDDLVVMESGDQVRHERAVESHDKREIRTRAYRPTGDWSQEAATRASAQVVPHGSRNQNGRRTRLDPDSGDAVMLAGNLTIISGSTSYTGTTLAGLYLLEEGAELTLEDVVLRGTILTRHGAAQTSAPLEGSSRPSVNVYGGLRLLAGTELPEVSMSAPDLVFNAAPDASIDIEGMSVVDEFEAPCRGTIRSMLVCESAEANIGADVRRPGYGRGAQSWPDCMEAGAERVTSMSFPVDPYTEELLDQMEAFDASSY